MTVFKINIGQRTGLQTCALVNVSRATQEPSPGAPIIHYSEYIFEYHYFLMYFEYMYQLNIPTAEVPSVSATASATPQEVELATVTETLILGC